ncbi:MAG TPA: FecR family protein, partial [Holophagaceae bacterium]|nr:FecR family protein [Holophagaceae bacterium]
MFTHPTRLVSLLVLPGLVMAAAPARAQDDENYQGEAPDRYAMVRTIEGTVRIHKGDSDEDLGRGTPVAEGDVVESRGRGVLQLGDGTRVAFGGDTRFTVAGLFTEKDGEKQILIRLDYGRLRVKMEGEGETRFRIDTPSGSATCLDRGTFDVEADRDGAARVRVQDGRVRFSNARDEVKLSAGEQLSVYGTQDRLDRVRDYNTYDVDDFDRWSDHAWVVRKGRSWDYIPPELRYYSDGLDENGEWVHSDEYGWVWRPSSVAEDWRPYYAGRWGCYPGGLTWVSSEPWGYVTYHHGRWSWSVGLGWCWIPGVYYSPAWVAWNNFDGYCGWAPLGYYNTPCTWGYGAWGGGYC